MTMSLKFARLVIPGIVLILGLPGYAGSAADTHRESPEQTVGTLKFLESFPEETSLNLPEFPEAHLVWPSVFNEAEQSINVASFYYSRIGDGKDSSAPAGVIDRLLISGDALKSAAGRGVEVKILGDSKFQKTYPEMLDWFDATDGMESRVIDAGHIWGGVMHAKYFIVDNKTLYVGSQNWDWRAMAQIRELGALITHPVLARQLNEIYKIDWDLAGSEKPGNRTSATAAKTFFQLPHALLETAQGQIVEAVLAASPASDLPADVPWDLPLLVELMDSATETLNLQLLSYNVSDREGNYFADLDNALRRAAARKVKVNILLSNWSKVHYKLHWIQSLAAVRNIEVKFSNIPDHSKGFIPFGRVEHPKFLTVDGKAAWVGTSNWSHNYFYSSRNISLFFDGPGAAQPLERFFFKGWNSPYTETVDPSGQYQPPKRS